MEESESEFWKEEDDRDSEELEFISCSSSPSISSQESLELIDSLELDIFVDDLTSAIIKTAQFDVQLEVLVKLEAQMAQAEAAQGWLAEGQLPGSCVPVEFADEETPVRIVIIEEEHQEIRTKSWWRRQANRIWKAIKSVANFCLRCQGLKRGQRSEQVLPV